MNIQLIHSITKKGGCLVMLFTNDKCTIKIEKAISKKSGKEYYRCVLTVNGKEYITFDSNLINTVLLDNLLKK